MLRNDPHVGAPRSRVDGPAKVTGAAKYAAEFEAPDLAYGYVVSSAVARGPHRGDRDDGSRGRAGRPEGVHAREPAAHGLVQLELPGRGGAARHPVPAAL